MGNKKRGYTGQDIFVALLIVAGFVFIMLVGFGIITGKIGNYIAYIKEFVRFGRS